MNHLPVFGVHALCLGLLLTTGCSDDTPGSGVDRGVVVDRGGPDAAVDRGGSDAAADSSSGSLYATVRSVVSPHVDPSSALTSSSKTVGMVVAAVGRSEEGVFGFGATSVDSGGKPNGRTLLQIGSVTKALTGLILARAVVDGGLKRGAAVDSLLPAFKGSNGTKNVTLGMLVTHHSGLASMPANLPKTDTFAPAAGYTLAQFKTYLFGLSAPVAAGKAYNYSNAGIGLLGLALQQHHKVGSYHDLLKKTLVADLGLTDIWGQVSAVDSAAGARLAQGYSRQGSKRVKGHPSQMGVLAPAGEIVTTGNTMLALLKALTGKTKTGLDAAVKEFVSPIKPAEKTDKIGYAVEIGLDSGGKVVAYKKPGSTQGGYTSYLAFRRDIPVGVMLMVNVSPFGPIDTLALDLLRKLAGGS